MSVLTQGTKVYVMNPEDSTVIAVACATAFNPGGAPADQIEDTCLEAQVRSYKAGLRTPGQATLTINPDPTEASHISLHEFAEATPQPTLRWVVGWSDGTDAPTAADGEWTLPATRTWFQFDGYVSDFPFSFEQNSIVTSEITIQRTGVSAWTKKVPA